MFARVSIVVRDNRGKKEVVKNEYGKDTRKESRSSTRSRETIYMQKIRNP